MSLVIKHTLEGTLTLALVQDQSKLDHIISLLNSIIRKENEIMATLDEVVVATEEEKTVIDSLAKFMRGLQDQIAANVTGLSAAQQAQIDSIFAQVKANTQRVADAMVANTPNA